jgi:regulator of sigma E protease
MDPDSRAVQAGLRSGHEVIAIDGEPTATWSDVNMQLFKRIGDTGAITLTVIEPGSDISSQHSISVTEWMSEVEQPYPTSDLGLMLRYPEIPAVIGGVLDGEPAAAAGFMAGDRVLETDGVAIDDWAHWVRTIQANPGRRLSVVVDRDDLPVTLSVTPRAKQTDADTVGYLGASRLPIQLPPEMQRDVSHPIYIAWLPAIEKTWSVTVFTLESIHKMVIGAISHKNLSGPITIAQVASATAESGLESFVGFIALLSISLGVLNLMPIPLLDGGHLLYYFFEVLFRKPVPERVQVWGLQMGMFIIVSIMLLAFYNDLTRL